MKKAKAKGGKKIKSILLPVPDIWSKTFTEFRTGRPATAPSVKVARKFWEKSFGEYVPTFEMLVWGKKKKRG
jgi:hypothetical protein